jgi:hypothetical protein
VIIAYAYSTRAGVAVIGMVGFQSVEQHRGIRSGPRKASRSTGQRAAVSVGFAAAATSANRTVPAA